jgi:hypothetical protein
VSDTKSDENQPTPETNPGAIDSSLFQDQEKTINSQINEFLATAQSSEPPEEEPKAEPVVTSPVPAPAPQDEVEHIAVTQAPPDATAAAADNAAKLADAVNDLLQKPGETAPAAPEATPATTKPEEPTPAPEVKSDSPPETSPSNTNEAAVATESTEKDSTVGAKKVIQPINDLNTSAPDLNALLEKEELKEAGVATPQVQAQPPSDNLVISADGEMQNPTTAPVPNETVTPLPAPNTTIAPQSAPETPTEPTTPSPTDPNDPNSIAL